MLSVPAAVSAVVVPSRSTRYRRPRPLLASTSKVVTATMAKVPSGAMAGLATRDIFQRSSAVIGRGMEEMVRVPPSLRLQQGSAPSARDCGSHGWHIGADAPVGYGEGDVPRPQAVARGDPGRDEATPPHRRVGRIPQRAARRGRHTVTRRDHKGEGAGAAPLTTLSGSVPLV